MKVKAFIDTFLASLLLLAACGDKSLDNIEPVLPVDGLIAVSVTDDMQNVYPGVHITLRRKTLMEDQRTNQAGHCEFKVKEAGVYEISLTRPAGTSISGKSSFNLEFNASQQESIDFSLLTRPTRARLNIGSIDVFGELRDGAGNIPASPSDLLYAINVFDAPLGKSTAIKAPDGHHIPLEEWQTASGTVQIYCNGDKATADIKLSGMIKNGTYTIWANQFKSPIKGGELPDLAELIKIVPIGSGTLNIMKADAEGNINVTIEHPSCILTEAVSLVIPIIYHINGNTYGTAHIPDEQEIAQLLIYL